MSMNHYDIIKVIGKGTFGRAILVRKKSNQKQLIIKQVTMSQLSMKEKKEALNEVNVLRQLKYPHIIKYRKSFEEHGKLCIVMDYAENGDLYQKIRKRKGKLFDEELILKWFVQIALALEYTHSKHILHRDLKTQNIFLSKNNDVLLGDFGIARVLQSTMECARTMVGTPYYLSPELCREEPYNHKSDVWSLGCILYELATHRHAFEANSMKGLVGKILRGIYPPISSRYSANLKHLIDICLQKDVRKRPSVFEILKMDYVKKYVGKYAVSDTKSAETTHKHPAKGKESRSRPPSSRPESRSSAHSHQRYADPPKFSDFHDNKAAEIKARIMRKHKREQEQREQQQKALDEKKAQIERRRQHMDFMEQKRKQMEVERHMAQQRALAERERLNEERRREEERRVQQQHMKREREVIYQEQQRRAESERRKIWQENRAAAMRNKQRLYDHVYGGADIEQQDTHDLYAAPAPSHQVSPDPQPNPLFSVRPQQQDSPLSHAEKQPRMNEEELAEFRKKQFWEAKIQAMKNRKRVLDQLYGESGSSPKNSESTENPPDVVMSKAPRSSHSKQEERLNDIQRRRKVLEEEIARKEHDLLERQPEFEHDSPLDEEEDIGREPPSKFTLDGKTLRITTSSRDSLCYRIEALRLHLEKELGLDGFVESYDLLQSQTVEDDDNELNDKLLDILGEEKLNYVSLIHQLIVCEEAFNENQEF
mmetsp:Transcript_1694/g.5941  ORF Transcript_1694/g.5941 Transcript_1694/m.5941 type:complete len:710 (-) Transcript_1694:2334-4463(-)|eukprot:CAMPEP_0117436150 /NCGR_PEP_ID=MMETSP0759-20121206/858_1 /TAXON_ID=63605 /ORGANISM="Percolomonas cosmopolitus, Strain WS" /LENGTH=709 /DNA_ID=CAMNT_0005227739 /DNA_START=130 /DNA_END=2259 /DNA_ORIENTATION=+